MQIEKINIINPDQSLIKKAAEILESGGIIIYPTDTAYGIGVNALDQNAVRRLYELKGRDFGKPTHVVVRDWEMINELTITNSTAKKLYDKFMPGPLTMVLKKKTLVPDILTAKLDTLGVRIPNCQLTKLLSSLIPFPYTTPSANRSGEPTPYSIDEVAKVLDLSKVDLVLDGGELSKVLPSTIVDLSEGEIKVVREGPVLKYEMENM